MFLNLLLTLLVCGAGDTVCSCKQEPLGAAPSRGLRLPDGLGAAVPFGRPLRVREQERLNSTKDIIYPKAPPATDAAAAAAAAEAEAAAARLYARSHGSAAPGEQRRRGYDWALPGGGAIDPTRHAFGRPGVPGEGAAALLRPDLDRQGAAGAAAAATTATAEGENAAADASRRLVADRALVRGDAPGRRRLAGAGDRPPPPGGAFGAPSVRRGAEPSVGELIRGAGAYSPEQQQPDADLGKSLRAGWRAAATTGGGAGGASGDAASVAGARAGALSCARASGARALLAPPKSCVEGVGAEELAAPRGEGEMRALAAAAGLEMPGGAFEEIFAAAAAATRMAMESVDDCSGAGKPQCTLSAFVEARHAWLRAHTAV